MSCYDNFFETQTVYIQDLLYGLNFNIHEDFEYRNLDFRFIRSSREAFKIFNGKTLNSKILNKTKKIIYLQFCCSRFCRSIFCYTPVQTYTLQVFTRSRYEYPRARNNLSFCGIYYTLGPLRGSTICQMYTRRQYKFNLYNVFRRFETNFKKYTRVLYNK